MRLTSTRHYLHFLLTRLSPQAVYYVLKSWYPVTKEQAIALGGLQLQAYVGDAGAVHTPGFLANDNNWKNYVPKHLRHTMPIQQWEVVRTHAPACF